VKPSDPANKATSPVDACEVAIARPFMGTLAYRVPDGLRGRLRPGDRVRVPLGQRRVIGVVDRVQPAVDRELRDILEVLDESPVLDEGLLQLCRWVADYYVAPLGLVVRAALPPGLMGGRSNGREGPAVRTRRVIRLVSELPTLSARDKLFGRSPRQREAFETLETLGGQSAMSHMSGQLGFSRGVLQGLVSKGVAELTDEVVTRDPFADFEARPTERLEPTPAQTAVIQALLDEAAAPDPRVALLHGVTGSGKTLVYLEVLEAIVKERGRSAIVLVPEISLTPQTVERFRGCFGDDVAVLHSGLSDGERYDAWRALKARDKRIAIGARSAVFAPVPDLGVIILDEEHEGSYKQSDTPRYHARSIAVMRARLSSCPCVLGSATPAVESWENARRGRYRLLELPERVTRQDLPCVELVDLRGETDVRTPEAHGRGGGDTDADGPDARGPDARDSDGRPYDARDTDAQRGPCILSSCLDAAIRERLERDEQVILLLNRRGYATFVQCYECGKVWSCRSCSVSLTYHRRRGRLVCHHCGFEAAPPDRCDACGVPGPTFTGLGTEQVERRLGELYPEARLERMDLDTTGTKWAHFEILERFRRREVDILLGTQMIAKGLDFPGVTLVGVVNADTGLNLPDFRASERTFQLLEQVAGRAGRGSDPGEVLVQTARPQHFALRAAAAHDYVGFAEQELEDRREPGYPPHRRLANLVISGRREGQVADTATELAEWTRRLIAAREIEGIDVVGPAPCPIDRLRDRWRWHFLLKSDTPPALGAVLRFLAQRRGRTDRQIRLEIDRDPEALL
jgi:primosomal protein N' (replication factor Y)